MLRPALLTTAAVLAAFGSASSARQTSGPVARYEMLAETTSGSIGGGGMSGMMALATGQQPRAQQVLRLDLGSSRAAEGGKPRADHFMPPNAKLGKSVALKTSPASPDAEGGEFERPKGRLLVYWGCGERAGKGQPVVIDFAKLRPGETPPGLWTNRVPIERKVTAAGSRSYGHWPSDDGKSLKAGSSLLGAHKIAATYAPEINFTLTKDFMGELQASSSSLPSGATQLRWSGVAGATGYHATLMGGKSGPDGEMKDVVWWTSSPTREFGAGLSDWLTPPTVARLVADRTVMSPSTTQCVVPAEVKRDAPDFMVASLVAFGPEESFAYPPRPADPKAAWNLEWTARILHRSKADLMIGMPGMDMAGADEDETGRPSPKKEKCKGGSGLGGMVAGALLGNIPGGGC